MSTSDRWQLLAKNAVAKCPRFLVMLPEDVVQTEFCLVSTSKILELLYRLHGHTCLRNECGRQLSYQQTYVGTCLVVNWSYTAGHFGGRWATQPTCSNLRVGNLLSASAIVLSGNSFTKMGFLFKLLNLQYFSKNLFNQYQNLLIAPVIDKYWEDMKEKLWKETAGKDVVLSGDGRNDSPGHCAQYCTYSFADMDSQSILQMNIVDVREIEGRKSTKMEQVAFESGMDSILLSPMVVKEVVTDGHLPLRKCSIESHRICHRIFYYIL